MKLRYLKNFAPPKTGGAYLIKPILCIMFEFAEFLSAQNKKGLMKRPCFLRSQPDLNRQPDSEVYDLDLDSQLSALPG